VRSERYCVKCRTYMSVTCFTLEDGSTHASICDRHDAYKKGLRFCRGCNDYVALDLFPKGALAYACKKHMKLHGGSQKAKKKQMENPDTKRRTVQWRMCYVDAKKFKHLLPMSPGRLFMRLRVRILRFVRPCARGGYCDASGAEAGFLPGRCCAASLCSILCWY